MILESAQILSTCHHESRSKWASDCYKATHVNHPCSIWARKSLNNYYWLYNLYVELNREFRYRRGKDHKSFTDKNEILALPPNLEVLGMTPFALAMPEEFKDPNPVVAYRNYYLGAKQDIAEWNWGRSAPEWWTNV